MVGIALEGTIMETGEWTPQQAADYVSESHQNTVAALIETGRRLHEAKRRVGHGGWLEALEKMPFGKRTAQAYMQIADHPDIANAHHGAHLPASWRTLSVLAQLPAGEVTRRIEAGEVTPEISRSVAEQMASVYAAGKQEALNAYSAAVDGLTAALSWANTYPPPDVIPEEYASVGDFLERAEKLVEIARSWTVTA